MTEEGSLVQTYLDASREGASLIVESAVQRFARGAGEFVWGIVGPLFGGLCDFIDDLDRMVRTADVLARRYRWGISTSWPPVLIATLGRLTDQHVRVAIVDRTIVNFYRADDWRELAQLVEAIASYQSIDVNRARNLRDAVEVIRAATRLNTFNAATFVQPLLFIELEGFCRDVCEQDADMKAEFLRLRARPNVAIFVSRRLRRHAQRIERHGLHLLENVIFRSYRKGLPRRGRRLSRHLQHHARVRAPRRMSDVVRIFLIIDLLAYLVDRRQGGASEHLQIREAWGEYLSVATQRGSSSFKRGIRPSEMLRQSRPWRQGSSAAAAVVPELPITLTALPIDANSTEASDVARVPQ